MASFEPLFEAGSLKFLMAIDYAQAAQSCAKMLAVRNPERVAAVLAEIESSGMNGWSVAIYGGPAMWDKLKHLGVHGPSVERLKKFGAVAVPGGVSTKYTVDLEGGQDVVIPLVDCQSLRVVHMTNVVFPLLVSMDMSIQVTNGSASFPALKRAGGGITACDARIDAMALTSAGLVAARGKGGMLNAPALTLADRVEAYDGGVVCADNLRQVDVLLDMTGGATPALSFPGVVYLLGELRVRNGAKAPLLPALKEAGRISLLSEGISDDFLLESLQEVHTGIHISGVSPNLVFSAPRLERVAGGMVLSGHHSKGGLHGIKPFLSLKRVLGGIKAERSYGVSLPALEEVVGRVRAAGSDRFSAPRLAVAEQGVDLQGATGASVPLALGFSPMSETVTLPEDIEISPDLVDPLESEVA